MLYPVGTRLDPSLDPAQRLQVALGWAPLLPGLWASRLELHSWQEEVAAIGMRGSASAPPRPSLSAQLFKDPSLAATAAWWLLGNPIPHRHRGPPPTPAPLLSGSSQCPIAEEYLAQNLPGLAAPMPGRLGGLE